MIISSQLSLRAEHVFARHDVSHQRLSVRAPAAAALPDRVDLSAAARAVDPPLASAQAQAGASASAERVDSATEQIEGDRGLQVLLQLIEFLTGRPARVFDSRALQSDGEPSPDALASSEWVGTAPRPQRAVVVERQQVIDERESTLFQAQGSIRTADGVEVQFQLSLQMSRHYHREVSERIEVGPAPRRKDPLVINFAGAAAELQSRRFSFDLDADGQADSLALLGRGSGFLVFDLNANGQVDNGRELFGALSGDGYADLARHDGDGNGWIDEADPIFSQLGVWLPSDVGGGQLLSLRQAGVSAISLSNIATEFGLRDVHNAELGQIRATGVYLRADGGVGTSQQVDLSV